MEPSRPVGPPTNDVTKCKTLYVGGLAPHVTDTLLSELFSTVGPVVTCKLIKDKSGTKSTGYGFVEFAEHSIADTAIKTFNGRNLYGQEVKVNWAFASTHKEDTTTHYHLFVGDLSPEVDDAALENAFSAFGGLSDARVMWDQTNNRSRGYGFVAYRRKEDAELAMAGMNGVWLGSRAIRVNWANHKSQTGEDDESHSGSQASSIDILGPARSSVDASGAPILGGTDPYAEGPVPPTNTSVYVGNVNPDVQESLLRDVFSPYGVVLEVRMQKGFAFVRYQNHEQAASAIHHMNGKLLDGKPIKCSWGKLKSGGFPPNKTPGGAGRGSHAGTPPGYQSYTPPGYTGYPAQYPPQQFAPPFPQPFYQQYPPAYAGGMAYPNQATGVYTPTPYTPNPATTQQAYTKPA